MNITATTNLGLIGPFELDATNIDRQIRGRSPGNYALGYVQGHAFIVQYVGRSDSDVNGALKQWVGQYSSFKWNYAISEKAAYEKQCQNFHDYGGTIDLDNQTHPQKPAGEQLKCKICGL